LTETITLEFGPEYKKHEVGDIVNLACTEPLKLDCGAEISNFPMAYQSYAVLVCHGLTGDQYLIGTHPITGKSGWWETIAGAGKALDTDKYFIICPNTLGGCLGSYGPKNINPETGKPFNLDFPVITITDMVHAQKLLVEYFGIEKLFCVIGGSMGGMQVLQWASSYPDGMHACIPVAASPRHSAQNIAFHEIGRQAIIADPNFKDGDYLNERTFPAKGLAVARMTAHVTYLSESGLQRKFGRNLQDRSEKSFGFEADFQIESYLRHQGMAFVDRFDPNSYLYITRALDYFDMAEDNGGDLRKAFEHCTASFCIISFSSDWLFPTSEAKKVVRALAATATDMSFMEIESDKGHDAFLLDEPLFVAAVEGFIGKIHKKVWGAKA
jgi:homoserine O-acetyltransferase